MLRRVLIEMKYRVCEAAAWFVRRASKAMGKGWEKSRHQSSKSRELITTSTLNLTSTVDLHGFTFSGVCLDSLEWQQCDLIGQKLRKIPFETDIWMPHRNFSSRCHQGSFCWQDPVFSLLVSCRICRLFSLFVLLPVVLVPLLRRGAARVESVTQPSI